MQMLAVILQNPADPEQVARIMATILPLAGFFIILMLAVIIVPFWFICKKAGMSPWLALLNLVPLGNIILLYILAFADWKVAPLPPAMPGSFPYPPPPQS